MEIRDGFLGRLAKWRISSAWMEIFDGLSGGVTMFESYFECFDQESCIKKLARYFTFNFAGLLRNGYVFLGRRRENLRVCGPH